VIRARHADHIDNSVQVAGHYVGFGMQPRVFVADTRASRYVEVSGRLGSVFVDPTAVLVVYGTTKKVLHPILPTAFVPLRDLPPMPACS
jgi:hypothetical protein